MIRPAALIVLILCLLPLALQAQSDSATVSGLIVDDKDAVIVGAQVRAIHIETGKKITTFTNGNGVYVLHDLRSGQYRLIVESAEFQQIVLVGFTLSAQDAVGRNFTMQIGSIIQSITLTASGQKVDISPAVGTLVNQQFVENLPLNGRSFQSLIGLTPGVVFVPETTTGSGDFSVNGQRADANYFTVDGLGANFATSFFFDPAQTVGGLRRPSRSVEEPRACPPWMPCRNSGCKARALSRNMGAVPFRSPSSPARAPTSFTGRCMTICETMPWTHVTTSIGLPSLYRRCARTTSAERYVRISSATPFNVSVVAGGPPFYCTRPDIVPGVPFYLPAPGQPGGRMLNPNAFTVPPAGQQGDLPRDYFRGFPIDQTDLSLRRQFHLTAHDIVSRGGIFQPLQSSDVRSQYI